MLADRLKLNRALPDCPTVFGASYRRHGRTHGPSAGDDFLDGRVWRVKGWIGRAVVKAAR